MNKVTQREIAEKTGVSQSTVSRRLSNADIQIKVQKLSLEISKNTTVVLYKKENANGKEGI